ncbi:MAG: twin-arginine translocation signal domain-containing protein, partial [Candidatus Hydrogenedens sp.]
MKKQSLNRAGHLTPSRRDFIKASAMTGVSFFIAHHAFSEASPLKV